MAQAPHAPGRSESNSSFIKRERKTIALFSVAFIGVSALTHWVLGSAGAGMIGAWPTAAPVPQQTIIISIDPTPTPKPTPTPVATPTPPPQRQQTQHQQQQPRRVVTIPVVPPRRQDDTGTPAPATPTDASPGPSIGGTPAPATATPGNPADGGTYKDATFLNKVSPVYPDFCKESGIQGVVIVLVTLGPDGRVLDARVEQPASCGALDQAALEAARKSTYTAPMVDGKPATQTYRIVYTFQLE
jgi:periplasmic protein TonB